MIKLFILITFFSFYSYATETVYLIEKKINLSLEKAARLDLEKEHLQKNIDDLQKKIQERKILLLKRSSALAFLKKFQFGALLERSESPAQLDRHLKIFERLNEFDLNLFKEYSTSLKMLAVSKANLEITIQEISKAVEKLKIQQRELSITEKSYLADINRKNLPSLIKLKGHLSRPLEGSVLWSFGAKQDDAKQFVFISKGILFKTQPGNEITSVGPGVVIFSDVLQHWRETLIIQHEDNYYSVYSGLKNTNLKVNDSVETKQMIGTANSDEFYFELRHFDTPINPKNWFKEPL